MSTGWQIAGATCSSIERPRQREDRFLPAWTDVTAKTSNQFTISNTSSDRAPRDDEDEFFYILEGTAEAHCGEESFTVGPWNLSRRR